MLIAVARYLAAHSPNAPSGKRLTSPGGSLRIRGSRACL
jgi:hypothetical protein